MPAAFGLPLCGRSCKTKCVPWREYFHIAINAAAATETFLETAAVGRSVRPRSVRKKEVYIDLGEDVHKEP